MTSSKLGKDGRIDTGAGNNMGGQRAPCIISGIQKGLEDALCKAMKEGKKKEGKSDIVECYSQVLRPMCERVCR